MNTPSLAELENSIGLTFTWKNTRYTVIEIIDQPATLIAQKTATEQSIQNDVHGRAHRAVRITISIPIFTADGTQLHPEFSLIQF
jgi:hypothetical protein